jgi:hypothetical protein
MKRRFKDRSLSKINKALFQLKQCLFFIVFASQAFAQIPTNSWRTHADYFNTKGVEVVEKNKVYCFSKNGFFYLDKTTNQSFTLSKLNDLSEINISQIRYNSDLKTLVIAYETGNLDLMSITSEGLPDKIQNIDFIKKTNAIQDSKAINQIEFRGDFAYLAADFGLVVLDVKKNEIKEALKHDLWWGAQECIQKGLVDDIWTPHVTSVRIQHLFNNDTFKSDKLENKRRKVSK